MIVSLRSRKSLDKCSLFVLWWRQTKTGGAMSWEIWVTCFHKGGTGKFPREILDCAFEPFSSRNEDLSWSLNDCHGTVYVGDEQVICGFSVHRPPGPDHPFWQALIEVLKQTTCVL